MCIFRSKGAGKVPRRHSKLNAGWHLPPARGGVSRQIKMPVLPGSAVTGLQEKFFTDFQANEPCLASRN